MYSTSEGEAALYIRFVCRQQRPDAHVGLHNHETFCRDYSAKRGWVLKAMIADSGRSVPPLARSLMKQAEALRGLAISLCWCVRRCAAMWMRSPIGRLEADLADAFWRFAANCARICLPFPLKTKCRSCSCPLCERNE